jgi:hypothetical protein
VGSGAQQLVLVPLAGDQALFAHSSYAGPRYLIVAKTATNDLEGVSELVLSFSRCHHAFVELLNLLLIIVPLSLNGQWGEAQFAPPSSSAAKPRR